MSLNCTDVVPVWSCSLILFIGTSTEDLYGEEMRLYLNKDDIILSKLNKESTLADNSIVGFCVSGHDSESKRNSMEGKQVCSQIIVTTEIILNFSMVLH